MTDQPATTGKIYDNILQTIGRTPLVRLPKIAAKYHVQADIVAKMEFFNPLASEKDRVALSMIEAAEREGKIKPGEGVIIEATSGNTAVSLAAVAAAKGYRLVLVMPESMPVERRKFLKFFGADVVLTPAEKGMKGANERAKELMKDYTSAWMPSQFDNPANAQTHEKTTAEEIWTDTGGRVDAIVCGVGTGGTITGLARALKAKNPALKTFAVEPAESAVLSGKPAGAHKIQGIGAGFVPGVLDAKLIDHVVQISSEQAFEMTRELAKLEGVPGGISSGAAIAAAIEVAKLPDYKDKRIVVIIPSFLERYITTPLFD